MAHRTALITAGSIAAVLFAAAIAVGANLGILTVADSRPVGKLSASTAVQPSGSNVVHVSTGATGKKETAASQKYVIKKAGSVDVAVTKTGVRLVDVNARPHWQWTLAQSADKRLTVTFRSGSITYTFLATLGRHGTILARVDRPITRTVQAPPSAGPSTVPTTTVASSAPTNPAPANGAATAPASGGESDDREGGEADD